MGHLISFNSCSMYLSCWNDVIIDMHSTYQHTAKNMDRINMMNLLPRF